MTGSIQPNIYQPPLLIQYSNTTSPDPLFSHQAHLYLVTKSWLYPENIGCLRVRSMVVWEADSPPRPHTYSWNGKLSYGFWNISVLLMSYLFDVYSGPPPALHLKGSLYPQPTSKIIKIRQNKKTADRQIICEEIWCQRRTFLEYF